MILKNKLSRFKKEIRMGLFFLMLKVLSWIYIKLAFWYIRRITWCIRFNCHRIQEILTKDLGHKYQEIGDEYTKKLVMIVSISTIFDFPQKGYEDFYENEKEIICKEVNEAIRRDNIRDIHLQNLLLMGYQKQVISIFDQKESNSYLDKAKDLHSGIQPLTAKEFKKIYRGLRTIFKAEKKKKEIEYLVKINLKYEDIKIFSGLASILFLCTGIFYNQLRLGYFGIEVSKFYNLGDYISTSIDKIYFTLIPLSIGVFLGGYDILQREKTERRGYKGPGIIQDINYSASVVFFAIYSVVASYLDLPQKYFSLSILIAIVIIYLLSKLTIKYFENGLRMFVILSMMSIFLLSIWSSTMREREDIMRSDLKTLKKYKIKFDDSLRISEESLVLLASNSNYYFFFDKTNKNTYVIPARFIVSVETKMP